MCHSLLKESESDVGGCKYENLMHFVTTIHVLFLDHHTYSILLCPDKFKATQQTGRFVSRPTKVPRTYEDCTVNITVIHGEN